MSAPYVAVIETDTMRLMGVIDVYTSMTQTDRWCSPGEWELTLPATATAVELMRVGRMIVADGYAGMIESIDISQADDADQIQARGCDLGGLLALRLALPAAGAEYAVYEGAPGAVMAQIVRDNCISPALPARAYPHMDIGTVDNSGESISVQVRYDTVAAVLESIGTAHGLCWRVRLDDGRMLLDIRAARDLSASQAIEPPVIYAPEYGNVTGQAYTHDVSKAYNTAVVAGSGSGAEREVCWVGLDAAGYLRRETYLTARGYVSLSEAGEQALLKYAPRRALEGELTGGGDYSYGKHWRVGDIITVRHLPWGVSMDVQVTEVLRVYEGDVVQIEAVLGDGALTLVDVVQRALATSEEEARR